MRKDKVIVAASLLAALISGCGQMNERENVSHEISMQEMKQIEARKEEYVNSQTWYTKKSDTEGAIDFDKMISEKVMLGGAEEDENIRYALSTVKAFLGDEITTTVKDLERIDDKSITLKSIDPVSLEEKVVYITHNKEDIETLNINYNLNDNDNYKSNSVTYVFSIEDGKVTSYSYKEKFVDDDFNSYTVEKDDKGNESRCLSLSRKDGKTTSFDINVTSRPNDIGLLTFDVEEGDASVKLLTEEEMKLLSDTLDEAFYNANLTSFDRKPFNRYLDLIKGANSEYYDKLNAVIESYTKNASMTLK